MATQRRLAEFWGLFYLYEGEKVLNYIYLMARNFGELSYKDFIRKISNRFCPYSRR